MKPIPKATWTMRHRVMVTCAMVLVSALLIWQVQRISFFYLKADLETRAEADLKVQVAVLDGLLDKYRLMVPLLARSPHVISIVEKGDVDAAGKLASITAGMSGALGVWFLSENGKPIAGSNAEDGFIARLGEVGIPKAYWEASNGQLGRQFLAATDSLPASYVFASQVRSEERLLGVVAARVALDTVEQAWSLNKDPIVASDRDGIVLVSNEERYVGQRLTELSNLRDDKRRAIRLGEDAVMVSTDLAPLDWQVSVFADLRDTRVRSSRAALTTLLICLLISAIIWGVLERRAQLQRNRRRDRALALRLERTVRSRTAELRRTQAELVQAGKLATLGRMSAALSHEYSQPLAAIQSNAEVAEMLISRGQSDKALGNLQRIGEMVRRMAEIARTLKGFSRRSGVDVRPVSLQTVVNEALLMLRPQMKQNNIELDVQNRAGNVTVLGGQVRLEQVLMNLLTNAVDAVRGSKAPKISLEVDRGTDRDGAFVELRVRDNGPGIEQEALSQIFEPFFTTKESGTGLGLGLSIAYKIMHDFSGSLTAENIPTEDTSADTKTTGGACFTMRLRIAGELSQAAE